MRLSGKVAVITGGNSGIGLATAVLYARNGARLVLGGRNEGTGRAAVECVEKEGGEALFLRTDVSVGEDVRGLVDAAVGKYGKLDILFNNAGIGMIGCVVDLSEADFDRLVAVNLKSVFLGCKYALPHLLRNPSGGVILNMSSNGGLIGRPFDPLYVATKHAVMGMTKSLALRYGARGIRVNAVCPGAIDTPMIWRRFTSGDDPNEYVRRVVANTPTPRLGRAEEVAEAALFLASDEARFVNGVGLAIDGGMTAGLLNSDRYRTDFPLLEEYEGPGR